MLLCLLCVCCVVVVWLLCGCGVVVVWLWCGCGVVVVWLWCGCCVVVVVVWLLTLSFRAACMSTKPGCSCRRCTNLMGQCLCTDPIPGPSTAYSKNCEPSRARKMGTKKCDKCGKIATKKPPPTVSGNCANLSLRDHGDVHTLSMNCKTGTSTTQEMLQLRHLHCIFSTG